MNLLVRFLLFTLALSAPLAAHAGTDGGSCTGDSYKTKICFDYSRVKTTTAVCTPGFQYSPGKCNTTGASGYCTTGPIDTYYWDSSSTAKDVCSLQGGVWNALSASGLNTGTTSAAKGGTNSNNGYSLVDGVCVHQDGRPSIDPSMCQAGTPSQATAGQTRGKTSEGNTGGNTRSTTRNSGSCEARQAVTPYGQPQGAPFWECPPGVTRPSTPPSSSGGTSDRGNATKGTTGGGTGGFSRSNATSPSVEEASDSCWDASKCAVIVKSQRWSKSRDEFTIVYKNTCKDRVYAAFGLEQVDGKWSSGADGIRPGKTTYWNAYNATGKSRIKWVGVRKEEDDWVCAGKVSNWNDP